MNDAASFDAIMQCNLLEVFCEALGAAIFVTDKLDQLSFASVRFLHFFPIPESALKPGNRVRDFYAALFDAGSRFGIPHDARETPNRENWIAERVAQGWKERVDRIEQDGVDRWYRLVSRRFSSGLGLIVLQDVSEHKKKEVAWKRDQDRMQLTEEILDTLPVAVAIKDRNLNFAAVNQLFCSLHGVSPENVIGKNMWDIFGPKLAHTLGKADWNLLAHGGDMQMLLDVPGQPNQKGLIHRARRLGSAGNYYISMTFDQIPAGMILPESTSTEDSDPASLIETQPDQARRQRVVCIAENVLVEHDVQKALEGSPFEFCVVRSEKEFEALLSAMDDVGLKVDRVLLAPGTSPRFALMAGRYDIECALFFPADIQKQDRLESAEDNVIDILAVEDNEVNRLVLHQILESLGLTFQIAESGTEAIRKLEELEPRILFADITLPDMSLKDFSRKFEEVQSTKRKKTPRIAIAPMDTPQTRQASMDAGFNDFLIKPLSPESIDSILRRHLLGETQLDENLQKIVA